MPNIVPFPFAGKPLLFLQQKEKKKSTRTNTTFAEIEID